MKTNLGHLEGASGITGFIKGVLTAHHGVAPPNLHFHEPNPAIPWEHYRLEVPTQPTQLKSGDKLWVVGIKGDHQLVHQESTVSEVEPLMLPLSRTLRFRDSNIEGIDLVNAPMVVDGVLVEELFVVRVDPEVADQGEDVRSFDRGGVGEPGLAGDP